MEKREVRSSFSKHDKVNGIRLMSVLITLLLHAGLSCIHSRDSG